MPIRAPSFMGGGKPGIKPPSFVSKAPASKTTTPTVSSPVPDLAPAPAPDQVTDSHVQALAKYMGYGPVSPETQTHRDLKEVLRRMSEEDKGVPIMDLIASAGKARVEELMSFVGRTSAETETEEVAPDPWTLDPEQLEADPESLGDGVLLPGEESSDVPVEEDVVGPVDFESEPDEVEEVEEDPENVDVGLEDDEGDLEEAVATDYIPDSFDEALGDEAWKPGRRASNWVGSNCAFASNSKQAPLTASRTSSGWNYDTLPGQFFGSRKELLAAILARRRTS
jgi:hypothetical protein